MSASVVDDHGPASWPGAVVREDGSVAVPIEVAVAHGAPEPAGWEAADDGDADDTEGFFSTNPVAKGMVPWASKPIVPTAMNSFGSGDCCGSDDCSGSDCCCGSDDGCSGSDCCCGSDDGCSGSDCCCGSDCCSGSDGCGSDGCGSDDDPGDTMLPTVSIDYVPDWSASVYEAGESCGYFMISAAPDVGSTGTGVQVDFGLGGTATSGTDYTGTITAGSVYAEFDQYTYVPIKAVDDYVAEPTEEVQITLQPSPFYKLNLTYLTYLIVDNDPIAVDLEIYKPAVVDPAMPMIPDSVELSQGSATFVNLDNDDQDGYFDIGDVDGVAADDELVRLHLKIKKTSSASSATLSALAGGGDVRVWKSASTQPGSEYSLGTAMGQEEFAPEGEWLVKDLWVEAITPHAAPRATVLRLQQTHGADTASDDVALTSVGIQAVEWIGYDNAIDDGNVLSADTNWPEGLTPEAKRVFPDARVFQVGGTWVQDPKPRSIVRVRATLTVAPPIPVKVYLAVFDVDDPTAEDNALDAESGPNDNRGSVFGWQASGVVPNGDRTKELLFAAGVTVRQADYIVSTKPGDNFRAVANADNDFLLQLNNNDDELGNGANRVADRQRIVDGSISAALLPKDREVLHPGSYCTPALTVWRFLNMELDTMPGVSVAQNSVSGSIKDFVGTGTALSDVITAQSLRDGSQDRDHTPTMNGRFENGKITIGSDGSSRVAAVQQNGQYKVTLAAPGSLAGLFFHAIDNDNFNNGKMDGTIVEVTKSGDTFVWQLNVTASNETPIDWNDYPEGGKIMVGGGVPIGIISANAANSTITTGACDIPFSLVDDDDLTVLPYPTNAIPNVFKEAYRQAYVEPVLAPYGHETLAAARVNMTPHQIAIVHDSQIDSQRSDNFWAAYNVWVFQFEDFNDGDSNPEQDANGAGTGWTWNDQYSAVAVETIRDHFTNRNYGPSGWGYATIADYAWTVTGHEVGHQFGLDHANGMMMGPAGPQISDSQHFSIDDLVKIRDRVKSPGR